MTLIYTISFPFFYFRARQSVNDLGYQVINYHQRKNHTFTKFKMKVFFLSIWNFQLKIKNVKHVSKCFYKFEIQCNKCWMRMQKTNGNAYVTLIRNVIDSSSIKTINIFKLLLTVCHWICLISQILRLGFLMWLLLLKCICTNLVYLSKWLENRFACTQQI